MLTYTTSTTNNKYTYYYYSSPRKEDIILSKFIDSYQCLKAYSDELLRYGYTVCISEKGTCSLKEIPKCKK